MIYAIIFSLLFTASLLTNLYLIFYRKEPKERSDSSELLMDLLDGNAIVRIERIDPADIFLRKLNR